MQRHQRHSMVNDVTWRAVKRAKIPAHKEPESFSIRMAKDRMKSRLYHGVEGKALTWDVTVPDTCDIAHTVNIRRGMQRSQACSKVKYIQIPCAKH